jgi:hypothetical protein
MQTDLSRRLAHLREAALAAVKPLAEPHPAFTFFFSVSDGHERARVIRATGDSADACWKAGEERIRDVMEKRGLRGRWLRVDWVTAVRPMTVGELRERLARHKRNYFRQGLAFDPKFQTSFLEQELNANAMLYGGNKIAHAVINLGNFAKYVRRRYGADRTVDLSDAAPAFVLSTEGLFCGEDGTVHRLPGPGRNAGRRIIERLELDDIEGLIRDASKFLSRQVLEHGRFVYGLHPCFNREIPAYNALRHASTTYSMIEAWEVTNDGDLKNSIDRALAYLRGTLIRPARLPDGTDAAFVVEANGEIKLGANAVAILALAKHATLTGSTADYDLMRQLALGIRHMQNQEDGSFVHVLSYPDLRVKDPFRVIYYEGEAAFGLMRLYSLTQDPRWIETVEKAFGHFIRSEHWRHNDHWLSYCVNELTRFRPEERYFRFGIQNVAGHLDFVLERITTFPTLLELMMAAREMLERIRTMPEMQHLLEEIDLDKFYRALEFRAHYLLNGHFWPELAMYFAHPDSIVGSFFIRHHAFRVRIDDVEHYLSGYVAYRKYRVAKQQEESRN